jgi:vacuolar-type H+-ATPase subunit I/STV1
MQMTLTTPALLFPALSLLLLAYTNRFLAIAALIRTLHKTPRACEDQKIRVQIANLSQRIVLIRNMQFFGIASLFFCTFSMFLVYISQDIIGKILFGMSLLLMLVSLGLSMREIQLSTHALNIQLSACDPIIEPEDDR